MRIIETCPKCGADIEDLQIATNPPIPVKRCTKCDWRWEGKKDADVIRVPFTEPDIVDPWKYNIAPNTEYWIPECCRKCSNHPNNGGSGFCACVLPYISYTKSGKSSTEYTIETSSTTTTEYMFGEDDDCG